MKIEKRNIVNFYELPEEWQVEAIENLDDRAEENHYLEPLPDQNPRVHILFDLEEAMKAEGKTNGFEYNAVIGISNNSAMLLDIDSNFKTAEIVFI